MRDDTRDRTDERERRDEPEPGFRAVTDDPPAQDDRDETSDRIGPPGTTQVDESLQGAPKEDSPTREQVERVEPAQQPTRTEPDR